MKSLSFLTVSLGPLPKSKRRNRKLLWLGGLSQPQRWLSYLQKSVRLKLAYQNRFRPHKKNPIFSARNCLKLCHQLDFWLHALWFEVVFFWIFYPLSLVLMTNISSHRSTSMRSKLFHQSGPMRRLCNLKKPNLCKSLIRMSYFQKVHDTIQQELAFSKSIFQTLTSDHLWIFYRNL